MENSVEVWESYLERIQLAIWSCIFVALIVHILKYGFLKKLFMLSWIDNRLIKYVRPYFDKMILNSIEIQLFWIFYPCYSLKPFFETAAVFVDQTLFTRTGPKNPKKNPEILKWLPILPKVWKYLHLLVNKRAKRLKDTAASKQLKISFRSFFVQIQSWS